MIIREHYFEQPYGLSDNVLVLSFCVLDNANHTIRRKGYANHYTPSHIARFILEIYDFALELLDV
jgi:hypothetical protein